MCLIIEIAAAPLLVLCIGAASAAFAAGKLGRSDGLSCAFGIAAERLTGSPLPCHQEAMRRRVLRQ